MQTSYSAFMGGSAGRGDVMLFQELLRGPAAIDGIRAGLQRRRWQATICPAVRTEAGGLSAGVAIAAKIHGNLQAHEAEDVEKRHPGRIRMAHWAGITKGGVVVASVYCYTGADAETRNADLLHLVARQLVAVRLPFVLGGDWNQSPADVARTGFPQRLKAFIAVAGEATYVSGGPMTELDFFVVSEALRPS